VPKVLKYGDDQCTSLAGGGSTPCVTIPDIPYGSCTGEFTERSCHGPCSGVGVVEGADIEVAKNTKKKTECVFTFSSPYWTGGATIAVPVGTNGLCQPDGFGNSNSIEWINCEDFDASAGCPASAAECEAKVLKYRDDQCTSLAGSTPCVTIPDNPYGSCTSEFTERSKKNTECVFTFSSPYWTGGATVTIPVGADLCQPDGFGNSNSIEWINCEDFDASGGCPTNAAECVPKVLKYGDDQCTSLAGGGSTPCVTIPDIPYGSCTGEFTERSCHGPCSGVGVVEGADIEVAKNTKKKTECVFTFSSPYWTGGATIAVPVGTNGLCQPDGFGNSNSIEWINCEDFDASAGCPASAAECEAKVLKYRDDQCTSLAGSTPCVTIPDNPYGSCTSEFTERSCHGPCSGVSSGDVGDAMV